MECYYVEEVFEQIDEEIAFFDELIKTHGPDHDYSHAIWVLEHIKRKLERLDVKEFQYGE